MTRIGYTYEAGFHCIRHTRARFPGLVAAHDDSRYPTYFDSENNEVRAVLDTDEGPDGYWSCEECVAETVAARDNEPAPNIHPLPWHVVVSHYGPEIYSGDPHKPIPLMSRVARVDTVFVAPEDNGRAEADAAFITHACNTHGRLVAALEAMVYAFPCRVAVNTIFDGQAASAIGQAWHALGEIKPRFFDSEEYKARNEKIQQRADYVLDALEEKRERDRAVAPQYDPRTEQDEAFAALAASARPFTNLTPEEHAQFLNDEVLWPFMDSSLFEDYEREYNEHTGTTEFRERFFAACSALLPLKKK